MSLSTTGHLHEMILLNSPSIGNREVELLNFFERIRFIDQRGVLESVEFTGSIPFVPKRVYTLSGVPENQMRGQHAHKSLQQIFICTTGSVRMRIDNGEYDQVIELNEESSGLYLPSGLWRELFDFSPGTVLIVIASDHYQEDDYIYKYDKFIEWKKQCQK